MGIHYFFHLMNFDKHHFFEKVSIYMLLCTCNFLMKKSQVYNNCVYNKCVKAWNKSFAFWNCSLWKFFNGIKLGVVFKNIWNCSKCNYQMGIHYFFHFMNFENISCFWENKHVYTTNAITNFHQIEYFIFAQS